AVREIESQHGVAGFAGGEVHRLVRWRARVRLHVRVFGAEQRLRARDRQAFDDVHVLAAAVVAASRVTFGVFVGEDGARRLEDGAADEVFRRDQLEAGRLPVQLVTNGYRDLRIRVLQQPPVWVHRFSAALI